VLATLQKSYLQFGQMEATLNPTNSRGRAVESEVDIVNSCRSNAEPKELVGSRSTPTGASLYVARPLRITNPACLQCHCSVEAAPNSMIEKYGTANDNCAEPGAAGDLPGQTPADPGDTASATAVYLRQEPTTCRTAFPTTPPRSSVAPRWPSAWRR
jgi:hypothetical protein